MFNILVDELPHSVEVEGQHYAINPMAPNMIRIAVLLEENIKRNEEAYATMALQQLQLFYRQPPSNLHAAMVKMIDFYSYSPLFTPKRQMKAQQEVKGEDEQMAYSYKYDASLIYAAFIQQYPQREIKNLHWWEFKALLEGLTEDCLFVKVTQYRTMKIDGKMDKEMKAFYRRMKAQWALPDGRSQEDKDADFAKALFYL